MPQASELIAPIASLFSSQQQQTFSHFGDGMIDGRTENKQAIKMSVMQQLSEIGQLINGIINCYMRADR